jgi:hypothetical protein
VEHRPPLVASTIASWLLIVLATGCSDADGAADAPDRSVTDVTATAAIDATDTATPTATTTTTTSETATTTTATTAPTSTAATSTTLPRFDTAGQPVPPRTAAELAARLTDVEGRLAAAGAAPPDQLRRDGHEHQVLHRTLARHPEWVAELTGTLDPGTLARALAVVAAGSAAGRTIGDPLAELPAWRIRPPLAADELTALYLGAEQATGTPWEVLAAINLVETRMGRIVGPSSAGAQGPMQFIPGTWERYGAGGDPYADADAIAAAGRLLADAGAPGDLRAAVYAYNPSDAYVESVLGYAAVLEADPWAYRAFWGWQVYVTTVDGLQWLPEGFEVAVPTPLTEVAGELPPPVPTVAPVSTVPPVPTVPPGTGPSSAAP